MKRIAVFGNAGGGKSTLELVAEAGKDKRVYHLRSPAAIRAFLASVEREQAVPAELSAVP